MDYLMVKLSLFYKILLLFFLSLPQVHAQVQNSTEKDNIEIKGIQLGMNKSDVEAILGTRGSPKPFSIAGISSKSPPTIFNRFIDDKLSDFSFYFQSHNFNLMRSAVKEKYPELTCETSEVKNRMGATFEQIRCILNSKSGYLSLSKFSLDLDTSGLVMTSIEESEKLRLEMEKKKKDI
jgi:hypothetical protein